MISQGRSGSCPDCTPPLSTDTLSPSPRGVSASLCLTGAWVAAGCCTPNLDPLHPIHRPTPLLAPTRGEQRLTPLLGGGSYLGMDGGVTGPSQAAQGSFGGTHAAAPTLAGCRCVPAPPHHVA